MRVSRSTPATLALALALALALSCSICTASGVTVDIVGRPLDADARLPAPLHAPTVVVGNTTPAWGLLPATTRYAGAWAHAVAVGRISGNRRPDVVVATDSYFSPTTDYRVFLFRPEGATSFVPPLLYPYGQGGYPSLAVVDLDGTHGLDVVVGGSTGITRLRAAADGTLVASSPDVSQGARGLQPIDTNTDGRKDIVAVSGTDTGRIHLNQGNGLLQVTNWNTPTGGVDEMTSGDIDGDGRLDVALGSRYGGEPVIYLYRNTGAGSLVYLQSLNGLCPNDAWPNASGVGIGDLNGDGHADIVASSGGNTPNSCLMVFHADGAGGFAAPVYLVSYDIPQTLRVADIDGDGRADVIVAHGGWQALGVYLQQADGSLADEQLFYIPYASHYYQHSFEIADLDLDGCADVVLVDYNNGLVTLRGTHCEVVFASSFE